MSETVKTYVPEAQKQAWAEHAEALDMSQSEFVRAMVQAGRRGFEPVETDSPDADPGGIDLEDRVLALLSTEGHRSWAELLDALAADFEEPLEETLRDLQDQGRVEHSGRHGGYTLSDE